MRKHWTWFLALLGAELLLALVLSEISIPADVASRWPMPELARLAPAIHNFDALPGASKAAPVYLAVTLLLTPFKVLFWVLWLRSDVAGRLVYFVPSPRYWVSATSGSFIANQPRAVPPPGFSLRGFVCSIFLAALCLTMVWGFLDWGEDPQALGVTSLPSIDASYRAIASGGAAMWAHWGFRDVLGSFLLAIVVLIADEFLKLLHLKSDKNGG